jgi:hypothetical protein
LQHRQQAHLALPPGAGLSAGGLASGAALGQHRRMRTPATPRRALAIGLLTLASLASCAHPPRPSAAAPALIEQIRAEIGDAACDSAQQCRSLAIGAKACGGPESYLAWSVKRSDGARLQALAERLREQREDENRRSQLLSNCALVTDPGARCVAGRCQLGDASSRLLQ